MSPVLPAERPAGPAAPNSAITAAGMGHGEKVDPANVCRQWPRHTNTPRSRADGSFWNSSTSWLSRTRYFEQPAAALPIAVHLWLF